jgi:hypothetical protein
VFFHIPKATLLQYISQPDPRDYGLEDTQLGTYWFYFHRTPPSELAVVLSTKDSFMAPTIIHGVVTTPAFLEFTSTQNFLHHAPQAHPDRVIFGLLLSRARQTGERWDSCLKGNTPANILTNTA